ncbi:MAG TPA: glycoside hydrolase, partial [Microbacterium sp.]|nr:glycoside hydrolase [Microbacterium sp.]
MTGLGSIALATAGVTPAVAATSDPTPITPQKVNPEVPVEDGDSLGAITDIEQDGATVTLEAEHGAFRATFLDERTLRLEATPTGEFTDPANTPENDPARTADIVVGSEDFDGASVDLAEGDIITISTPKVALEVDRATGTTTLTRSDGSIIWSESAPLSFGTRSATQHLDAVEGEQFLGGGMQNGRSIHTGATINIARNFDWDDDGYPNAVPYYMSSNGYGVMRNTFAAGSYD